MDEGSEKIGIRRATLADLPALCRLAEALVGQHVGYDAGRYQPPEDLVSAYSKLFREQIDSPGAVVVVAELNGEVVGYVLGMIEPPSLVGLTARSGWIHDIYMAPRARGLGGGSRLLDAAIDGLVSIGCPGGVLLGVAPQNWAAAALFRKRGFRATLQEMSLGPRGS
jgi:ribosomal protein S18 acetylase RimI-like enzyme